VICFLKIRHQILLLDDCVMLNKSNSRCSNNSCSRSSGNNDYKL